MSFRNKNKNAHVNQDLAKLRNTFFSIAITKRFLRKHILRGISLELRNRIVQCSLYRVVNIGTCCGLDY